MAESQHLETRRPFSVYAAWACLLIPIAATVISSQPAIMEVKVVAPGLLLAMACGIGLGLYAFYAAIRHRTRAVLAPALIGIVLSSAVLFVAYGAFFKYLDADKAQQRAKSAEYKQLGETAAKQSTSWVASAGHEGGVIITAGEIPRDSEVFRRALAQMFSQEYSILTVRVDNRNGSRAVTVLSKVRLDLGEGNIVTSLDKSQISFRDGPITPKVRAAIDAAFPVEHVVPAGSASTIIAPFVEQIDWDKVLSTEYTLDANPYVVEGRRYTPEEKLKSLQP